MNERLKSLKATALDTIKEITAECKRYDELIGRQIEVLLFLRSQAREPEQRAVFSEALDTVKQLKKGYQDEADKSIDKIRGDLARLERLDREHTMLLYQASMRTDRVGVA